MRYLVSFKGAFRHIVLLFGQSQVRGFPFPVIKHKAKLASMQTQVWQQSSHLRKKANKGM